MSASMIARLAWRSIWRNRRRTAITVTSIGIGLAMAVFFIAFAEGVYAQLTDSVARMQAGHVTIEPPEYRRAPNTDLFVTGATALERRVAGIDGVEFAKRLVVGQAIARTGTGMVGAAVVGVQPAVEAQYSPLARHLVSGTYLADGDTAEAVIGKQLAARLHVTVGNKLVLTANDIKGNLVDELCYVKGIFESGSGEIDGHFIQVPIGFASAMYRMPDDSATQIGAILERPDDQAAVMARIRALAGSSGRSQALAGDPTGACVVHQARQRIQPRLSGAARDSGSVHDLQHGVDVGARAATRVRRPPRARHAAGRPPTAGIHRNRVPRGSRLRGRPGPRRGGGDRDAAARPGPPLVLPAWSDDLRSRDRSDPARARHGIDARRDHGRGARRNPRAGTRAGPAGHPRANRRVAAMISPARPIVEVHGITKDYGRDGAVTHALRGIDLRVDPGEFTAVVGPSGSGKSTLLNIIGGLDRPTAGWIELDGRRLGDLSDTALGIVRRDRIGFIFQNYNLLPVLTAAENAEYVLMLQGVGASERRARVRALLDEIGLGGMEDRFPRELSGGQQQRVAIARAIVTQPALVLADEPTANVDSTTAQALLDLMTRINGEKGVTFVFSTHDPSVMARARRLVRLKDGLLATA
jgi:putative ABC transport system ATP-binding protein